MIAYVDGRRGISGTSLLAALLDAGADVDEVAARTKFLTPRDLDLRLEDANVDGLRAARLELADPGVRVAEGPTELLEKIDGGGLASRVRDRVADVYDRLATAEARAHGVSPDDVRFEELATLRSVVGVVGSAVALDQLGIESVAASWLPFGGGEAVTHHGLLPLPAPATLELLRGIPVRPQTVAGELVTPTGAALLASLAPIFGEIPAVTIRGVGHGTASTSATPILTRVVLGSR
jgi:pyridinium-3,5-bisthiocarboxylic acid mononucleotide nickel chelatase